MTDRDTTPAPPPDSPSLPDMVKVELETLRLERDTAIASARFLNRTIKRLQNEIEKLKGRHGHF